MSNINDIYEAIDADGFSKSTLHLIDEYINDIENGRVRDAKEVMEEFRIRFGF